MTTTDNPPLLDNLLRLDGQRALVTGASGNIGRGIARRIAEAGAEVLVHYCNDHDGAERTVDEIVRAGGEAQAVQADLSSGDGAASLLSGLDGARRCSSAAASH